MAVQYPNVMLLFYEKFRNSIKMISEYDEFEKIIHNYVNVKFYSQVQSHYLSIFFQCKKEKIPRVYGMIQAYSID